MVTDDERHIEYIQIKSLYCVFEHVTDEVLVKTSDLIADGPI